MPFSGGVLPWFHSEPLCLDATSGIKVEAPASGLQRRDVKMTEEDLGSHEGHFLKLHYFLHADVLDVLNCGFTISLLAIGPCFGP